METGRGRVTYILFSAEFRPVLVDRDGCWRSNTILLTKERQMLADRVRVLEIYRSWLISGGDDRIRARADLVVDQ